MIVDKDGQKLIAGGKEDGSIQIFDLNTFIITSELQGHTKFVTCLANFDKFLVSGSYFDKYIYVWDLEEDTQDGIIKCRGPINNIFIPRDNS